MKLAASVIARNEADRYLRPCLQALLEFCDEIRLLDDSSTDGTRDLLADLNDPRIVALHHDVDARNQEPDFHLHAAARNRLLHFTLEGDPTYVLAIDADELVTDGAQVRQACSLFVPVVSTVMAEVWEACDGCLCIREDGGWRSRSIGNVWHAPTFRDRALSLIDRGHATGRVPEAVHRVPAIASGAATLHFGWANRADRAERFKRYDLGDGGKYHAASHIASIMWPDARVALAAMPWPDMPAGRRDELLARANRP